MRLKNFVFSLFVLLLVNGARSQGGSPAETGSLPIEGSPENTTLIANEPEPSFFRLPPSILPLHYLIRLQPFLYGNFSIHGYTEINVDVTEATSEIFLHIKDIITRNDTLKIYKTGDTSKATQEVSKQRYDKEREFYIISMTKELEKGQYTIQLAFIGLLNDKLKGFYRSSYTDGKGVKKWIAASQMQPTSARLAFPCFDEPALKAKFSIELVRQQSYSSISNMPLKETTPLEGYEGWVVDTFERSVKMSTYLVAFIVSDFVHVSAISSKGTLIRVWTREETIHQTEYALRMGQEILEFFEDFFQIPFPLPKIDHVALPDFGAGAMENWGLINYREAYLVYDPVKSSIQNKIIVGSIIAHELAHQWFGNLVTPSWWTDLWLNEGFATYMASFGYDAVEPSLKIEERFVPSKLRSALMADSLESSHPISIPVGHPDEIGEIFDAISYSKGATVIRMMLHFLTKDTFQNGITNYLNKFSYSAATQDDLWDFLTIQGTMDGTLPDELTVKDIMDTWTLQMGYPVINVTLNSNGTATLTQERFLKQENENSTDTHDYKWFVPITFTHRSNANFSDTKPRLWMKPTEATKTISVPSTKDDWFVFNIRQTGFYRVNYDMDNWKRLSIQFKKDFSLFDSTTRVQIVSDAFALSKAGRLSYSIPLDFVQYVVHETEYNPLTTTLGDIRFVRSVLKNTELYEAMKNFNLKLVRPHYDHIGFEAKEADSVFTIQKRSSIVPTACYLEYAPCLEAVKKLYSQWMLAPEDESLIPPHLQGSVYCNGIKYGGVEEWNFAWEQYFVTSHETKKKAILSALGCTRNTTLKLEILDSTFKTDSPFRKQDASSAFRSVIRDKESGMLAWNYLRDNFETIYEYIANRRNMMSLVNSASGHIRTYEELAERDNFINLKEILQGPGTRSLAQARERIVFTIKWLEHNFETIRQWLIKQGLAKTETLKRNMETV